MFAQFVIIISGNSQEDIHQKYLMHNFKQIFGQIDQKGAPELVGFVARALQTQYRASGMAAMLLLFVQLLNRAQYPDIFSEIINNILEFQQNLLMYSVDMSCVVLKHIQQETKSLDQLNARAMPMFI